MANAVFGKPTPGEISVSEVGEEGTQNAGNNFTCDGMTPQLWSSSANKIPAVHQ